MPEKSPRSAEASKTHLIRKIPSVTNEYGRTFASKDSNFLSLLSGPSLTLCLGASISSVATHIETLVHTISGSQASIGKKRGYQLAFTDMTVINYLASWR